MRKQIILFIAVLMSIGAMAQTPTNFYDMPEDGTPTKFLGIPVDGTKQAMIQKLQAKGFTYDREYDDLEGYFNGCKSVINIITNWNKVWRIQVVEEASYTEGQIRIRYNNLLTQFLNNANYLPAINCAKRIPDDEDISYEMSVNAKVYESAFLQKAADGKFYRNHQVWFTIINYDGDYRINIFYDNPNNGANGEDL